MPSSNNHIRPVVICVFQFGKKILVCSAADSVKKETYYRPLGGGIEFQESALSALKREIFEELRLEIRDEKYLGAIENIFVLEGKPKHEIILVFDAAFADDTVYQKKSIEILETGWENAVWKSIDEFASGKLILYPPGILDLIPKS